MWTTGSTSYEPALARLRCSVCRAVRTGWLVNRLIMLSSDALKRIDREIAKYPPDHRQSAVIAALAIAQDEHAWLSTETRDFVAHYLRMPPITASQAAHF